MKQQLIFSQLVNLYNQPPSTKTTARKDHRKMIMRTACVTLFSIPVTIIVMRMNYYYTAFLSCYHLCHKYKVQNINVSHNTHLDFMSLVDSIFLCIDSQCGIQAMYVRAAVNSSGQYHSSIITRPGEPWYLVMQSKVWTLRILFWFRT